MTTIFEMARNLGHAILDTDESKRLEKAKSIFYSNEEAQKQMDDYKDYQKMIQSKMEKGELTNEEFREASVKLTQMGSLLKKDPIIGELISAETSFNKLANQVISILKLTITGTEEESCSSCSGSCQAPHALRQKAHG